MNILGLTFVLVFLLLMLGFWVFVRRQDVQHLRPIEAFTRLQNAIALAVEDGSRLHVSLGHGNLIELQAASALIGLHMLQRVVRVASDSDQPPIATSGNGVTALVGARCIASRLSGHPPHRELRPWPGAHSRPDTFFLYSRCGPDD